jgi:hypothetical protein
MANAGHVRPVWNVRESPLARAQLDALTAADPRFDKIWIGVRWLIIRDPILNGQIVPGKESTYVHKTNEFLAIGMKELLVTYSIIEEKNRICEVVSILDAHAAKNGDIAKAV